uniref:Transmembrane protein 232 n=1 Tax=Leptobrachium leishanense TaxID=445787 RepID=A0A8C5LSK6_9ANUR
MPILKVPVVQKFGIISNTYHIELQKRILEEMEGFKKEKTVDHRSPLEITEEFIKQYNNAKDKDEEERLLDTARKILQRCERGSGINSKGSGSHVNLHHAWTDLILLAQCKGKIQEDALDLLFVSMDQAYTKEEHIPLLFFIAESVLFRLCLDVSHKPYPVSSKVKLSKVGFLTFLRLYIFYITGQLQAFQEQKERLSSYLEGLASCDTIGQHHPNVLFSVHVMLKIGETICTNDSLLNTATSFQKSSDIADILNVDVTAAEMNPFVMHCLLIWLHVQRNSADLHEIIDHLFRVEGGINQKNWLDSIIAVLILGDAAKLNASCLKALMELAKQFTTYTNLFPEESSNELSSFTSLGTWVVACGCSMVLADICMHGSTSEIQKNAFMGFHDESINDKDVKEACLKGMLNIESKLENSHHIQWFICFCAVYNLAKVNHELLGDRRRDGLRNAIWRTLSKHRSIEMDAKILEAVKLAETELNGPANLFFDARKKVSSSSMGLAFSQFVGCRLASALAQKFFPPAVHCIPSQRKLGSMSHRKVPERKDPRNEKISAWPSLSCIKKKVNIIWSHETSNQLHVY